LVLGLESQLCSRCQPARPKVQSFCPGGPVMLSVLGHTGRNGQCYFPQLPVSLNSAVTPRARKRRSNSGAVRPHRVSAAVAVPRHTAIPSVTIELRAELQKVCITACAAASVVLSNNTVDVCHELFPAFPFSLFFCSSPAPDAPSRKLSARRQHNYILR